MEDNVRSIALKGVALIFEADRILTKEELTKISEDTSKLLHSYGVRVVQAARCRPIKVPKKEKDEEHA